MSDEQPSDRGMVINTAGGSGNNLPVVAIVGGYAAISQSPDGKGPYNIVPISAASSRWR